MTPPSHGWRLMRDAALSLAETRDSAAQLANPRQMTPYTYAESPATAADDPGFGSGAVPGAMLPEVALGEGFLSERLGRGFTLIAFGAAPDLRRPGLTLVTLPATGAAAELFGAVEGSAYLVRPDLHIAARWRRWSEDGLDACLARILGRVEEMA